MDGIKAQYPVTYEYKELGCGATILSILNENDTEGLQFLDLNGIHWGYLNCWQSVTRGKKSKVDSWYTFWVDLCGNTMRLYKDKSLPPDSDSMPPSASVNGPAPEHEQKFAFFGLKGATVEIISDLNLYQKKLKPADFTRIFRRHLFQVVLTKLNSTYVFQAPSNSSMLRWVSKIQEAIAISENEQLASAAADEQAKFANFVLQQRRLKPSETTPVNKPKPDTSEEDEEMKKPAVQALKVPRDPRLKQLQDRLREKIALYQQICLQEQQFLGGEFEQEIRGSKSVGTALQDYYLVPGRIETFICKGVKMTLFGQLPNKRWRCWVEIDDVIKAMNDLIAESACKDGDGSSDQDSNNNAETVTSVLEKNKEKFGKMQEKDVSDRTYPIIGAVPTSLIAELRETKESDLRKQEGDIKDENEFISETPPANSPTEELENPYDNNDDNEQLVAAPYASHNRRTPRKTNSQLSFDSLFFAKPESADPNESLKPKPMSGSFPGLQTSPFFKSGSKSQFDKDESLPPPYSPSSRSDSGVRLRENGFVIKKRLRQKGISIMVGSSSSEDESDEDSNNGRKIKVKDDGSKSNEEEKQRIPLEEKRLSLQGSIYGTASQDLETENEKRKLSASKSVSTLPGKFTANTELLDQFGLRSASIGSSDAAKMFPKIKGPDVKPPRNERRTLKLSKHPDKGYGFYLQTFVFTQANGDKDRKTFVRYVEEEGPAYMSGLREGDVIVEINGEDMEPKDHAQLVNIIKNSEKELLMVVKFIDAMKRAELCIRLKKKKAKLRSRLREYEELLAKENDYQENALSDTSTMKRSDSTTSSGIGLSDDSSDNLAENNEQVVIQTSRFEERCSAVFDCVKEIRYADDTATNANSARTHITTSFDLLSAFSTDASVEPKQAKKANPVHRSRSFSGSGTKEDMPTKGVENRRNSKDDGFITGIASLTKSRPATKVISNKSVFAKEGSQQQQQRDLTKRLDSSQDKMFYNPSQGSSMTLPAKYRAATPKKDRSGLPVKDYSPGNAGTLSNPSRDRILSRNSRPKSYKMAVSTGAQGSKRVDQVKQRRTPETDL